MRQQDSRPTNFSALLLRVAGVAFFAGIALFAGENTAADLQDVRVSKPVVLAQAKDSGTEVTVCFAVGINTTQGQMVFFNNSAEIAISAPGVDSFGEAQEILAFNLGPRGKDQKTTTVRLICASFCSAQPLKVVKGSIATAELRAPTIPPGSKPQYATAPGLDQIRLGRKNRVKVQQGGG